ncbi:thioredoxin family protein [Rubinisphaera italica]|uniref:Thiol:disulfide interchange protein n=1 Tax=Rubinisphaera italica TaxID=2527969 RepID=A0A5C5XMA2_9PLAN|nr:thioredoxin family protein [Rubinisphaera italica]TWT64024.1 thiol:disulfide interchange protein precursor [Rubinisphaera italica]
MYRMTITLLVTAAVSLNAITMAQDHRSLSYLQNASSVDWTTTPQTAIHLQQVTGRPLLVYVTADYCGYCRKMERDTWSNEGIVRRIQDKFIPLKLDAKTDAQVVSRLGIKSLPSTILFNSVGQHIQTITGYSRPEALLPVLDNVSTGSASASKRSHANSAIVR